MTTRHQKKGLVHAVATCDDCGKAWSDYKTARRRAYKHSLATGHHTHGEEAVFFQYGVKK